MPVLANLLDNWTGRASVFELFRIAASILGIVIVWACVALATKAWLLLATLCFIIVQDELGIVPLVLGSRRQPLHDLALAMLAGGEAGVENGRS